MVLFFEVITVKLLIINAVFTVNDNGRYPGQCAFFRKIGLIFLHQVRLAVHGEAGHDLIKFLTVSTLQYKDITQIFF